MSKSIRLADGSYLVVGRSKASGSLTVWIAASPEYEWKGAGSFATMTEVKKFIKRLAHLAELREYRQTVRDITGTSYAAARRDMGR